MGTNELALSEQALIEDIRRNDYHDSTMAH
ncbi:hypothetical protein BCO37747_07060 [Burkholderia contaminans]|jgi:hypothetical protein|nr:hypothetical protein SK875_C01081 [Burkholderia contaminans]VWB04761.1 hypothetical protein BCO23253_00009 [Burkholderia contaminans]VWD59020.1 hypothetical protein BCO37747_07060 [Burkholderia contaminans]